MLLLQTSRTRILEHAAFWGFIFLFVFDYHFLEENMAEAIGKTLLEVATYAVIVYFNLLLLVPFLLEKKRPFSYAVGLAAIVGGYVFSVRATGLESEFYEMGGWRDIFSMVLNTSLFLLISTLYWFFKQAQIERERQFLLKNEKLEAELNFLRAQIGPHFLFNTLNNIYALALQKHDNAAPMIAKLSALLRHILYEGNRGEVFLKKELDTLKQYVELHLLRKPRSQNVDFHIEGSPDGWKIEPMLLLNFVENAFKHSNLDQDEKAWIKIHCDIGEAGEFVFSTQNSAAPAIQSAIRNPQSATKAGGIGLQNTQRQLELKYPGAHQLTLKNGGGTFEAQLHLTLKKA